ncbi:uncharacterized protein TNCV_3428931 [Trichonephila clavipes]|nr:uncharacterized protein TNCV_3428931 [Trichonephila clavipes]
MARRNHLDDFTRGRMIGKLEEGRTVTSVAAELRINKSVVSCACQQASFLSNSVQQRGDKCRGLLWPDAFTKMAYSPIVVNAASRIKLTTDATVYSGAESTETGQLNNEVVYSLWMRVGSVPEVILNAV